VVHVAAVAALSLTVHVLQFCGQAANRNVIHANNEKLDRHFVTGEASFHHFIIIIII